jgi:hypothetical protein
MKRRRRGCGTALVESRVYGSKRKDQERVTNGESRDGDGAEREIVDHVVEVRVVVDPFGPARINGTSPRHRREYDLQTHEERRDPDSALHDLERSYTIGELRVKRPEDVISMLRM